MLELHERWVGPFEFRKLLDSCADRSAIRPPEVGSAYLVTRRGWRSNPTPRSLYVGGTTGKTDRFRTRIGDLVADMFGFYAAGSAHHSGGRHLYEWCGKNEVSPLGLHIAWVERTGCHRCLEVRLHRVLNPIINRMSPARCATHVIRTPASAT